VSVSTAGPQVLKLSYDGPSPAVSQRVVQSLIKQLGAAGSAFGDGIGKTASTLYRHKLAVANSLVASNQGSLAAYVRGHPQANASNDATFRALASEVKLAEGQRGSIQAASSQANAEAKDNGGSATLQMLDAPSLPRAQVTGLASRVSGLLSGAFAGLVLSLFTLIVLTPRPPTRWDAEVPFFARIAAWDSGPRRGRGSSAPSTAGALRPRPELHARQEGA
jgi:hypothetical protein